MGKIDALLTRAKGQRVYIDANFFIYFLNQESPYFDVVAPIIRACDHGVFTGFTGDAVVAEVMVHPYRLKSPSEIAKGKGLFSRENFLTVVRHDAAMFDLASQLRASSTMRMLDALHYATAVQSGCRFLLTNDRDFKTSGILEVVGITSLLES